MTKPRKCFKCKQTTPFMYGWYLCAEGKEKFVCEDCDRKLNYIALRWAYGPDKAIKMVEKYKARSE